MTVNTLQDALVVIASAALLVSGLAKLIEPRGLQDALSELGFSTSPGQIRLAATGEIALGAFLGQSGTLGRSAAALLFMFGGCLFYVGLLGVRARSKKDCGCFGALSTHTIGYRTLAWAAAFLAIGILRFMTAGDSPASGSLVFAERLALSITAPYAVALFGLLRLRPTASQLGPSKVVA